MFVVPTLKSSLKIEAKVLVSALDKKRFWTLKSTAHQVCTGGLSAEGAAAHRDSSFQEEISLSISQRQKVSQ